MFLLGLVVLPPCGAGNCWISPDWLSLQVSKNTHKEHCLNCLQTAIQSLWVLSLNNSLSVHGLGRGQLNKSLYHQSSTTCASVGVLILAHSHLDHPWKDIQETDDTDKPSQGDQAGLGGDLSLFVPFNFQIVLLPIQKDKITVSWLNQANLLNANDPVQIKT